MYGATFRPDNRTTITLDVEARNGLAVATINTAAERMTPTDAERSGTATWIREAFGLTTSPTSLHGDAALTLNLSALTGSLGLTDFTGYRDLNFNVRWAPDGLIRTSGGAAGAADGWLYGPNGSYAAGTAHTSDAAFVWAGETP